MYNCVSKSFFICIMIFFVFQVWKFAKRFSLDSWIERCVCECALNVRSSRQQALGASGTCHWVIEFLCCGYDRQKDPWWRLYTLRACWIFLNLSSNRLIINEAECSRRSAWYDGCRSDSYWERYWDMYAWRHRSFVLTSQTQLSSHMVTGLLSANHVLTLVKTASKQSNILETIHSNILRWSFYWVSNLHVLAVCVQ